jgi:hypothetical protein
MGITLKLSLLLLLSVFAMADEKNAEDNFEVEPPKSYECVGWIVGLQTHHLENQDFKENQITTLEDLYDIDLKPVIGIIDHIYYYNLVKKIQFQKQKSNEHRLVYYFEGYSAIEFLDGHLQNAIRYVWGYETVREQIEASLKGKKEKMNRMFRYAKYGAYTAIAYALSYMGLTHLLDCDHTALITMEKISPAFLPLFAIPFSQGFLDRHRYLKTINKLSISSAADEKAVELAKNFNLDLYSKFVSDAISETSDDEDDTWGETFQEREIEFQYLKKGTLTFSYGRKKGVPFLLLAVDFKVEN